MPYARPLPMRVGDVVFRPLSNGKVAFLAPPGYENLMRMFGGVQKHEGGRWVLPAERAASLIARLREYSREPSQ